ncbi:UvrD-helicase domain-containing protein [Dyadobacter sandarakinus]|uniref:ATP-dependent helicase n=1 Tax=Dyadobacter sandarakinus TaxID=2747268 RepID=A0ABX7I5P8_9BACT|nr:ATP-dependent helicase [Dyadobacter sandarakinus]QRR00862.1 ATP-dependent helicase [Dyadobacter sandarakinus]
MVGNIDIKKMVAFEKIQDLLVKNKSFVLEAGAGSGKTFTLIQTIAHLIAEKGKVLSYNNKKIVCITYTNVARNEIVERLEYNPLLEISTIHEFLWGTVKNFQSQLFDEICLLNEERAVTKPDKYLPDLKNRVKFLQVTYADIGYRDFEKGRLHHDDVIEIAANLIEKYPLLTKIVVDKYPYIFIDEYQDTSPRVVDALLNSMLFIDNPKICFGFFGDSFQKIYDGGVGTMASYIDENKLFLVEKSENYRSSAAIVKFLNKFRTSLQQVLPSERNRISGSVSFINCDNYPPIVKGQNKTDYEKSLQPYKDANYDKIISSLESQGWNFGKNSEDKILIIANSRVAERSGFGKLYKIASSKYGEGATEQIIKREHVLIKFFTGSVDRQSGVERGDGLEHLIEYYTSGDYNGIVSFLNSNGSEIISGPKANRYFKLVKHEDKQRIFDTIDKLQSLRLGSNIGSVLDYLIENNLLALAEPFARYLEKIAVLPADIPDPDERIRHEDNIKFYTSVRELPYNEIIELFKFVKNETVFSTKHGTKGDQFRNVLVIIDDTSWKSMYNFQNFIGGSESIEERFLRTRNLFYVCSSRAKENLVILSLSEMGEHALTNVQSWLGKSNIFSISHFR